jgi:hypothetical protein
MPDRRGDGKMRLYWPSEWRRMNALPIMPRHGGRTVSLQTELPIP